MGNVFKKQYRQAYIEYICEPYHGILKKYVYSDMQGKEIIS